MKVSLSAMIEAPIDEVFAYFDDPANTLEFTSHAKSFDVVSVAPDDRRTFDAICGQAASPGLRQSNRWSANDRPDC